MAEQNVFNLMQNDEIGLLWKKIYQLHQKTKIYLLTAEEISENGDALIQPLKEHRDAYDHIVRIFAKPPPSRCIHPHKSNVPILPAGTK